MFVGASARLPAPSSRLFLLCCRCLVVQKDGAEGRSLPPPFALQTPPIPLCVLLIIMVIKKACKSVVEFA